MLKKHLIVPAIALLFLVAATIANAQEFPGSLDWENMRAVAVGVGIPPANAGNQAQSRAMGQRASVLDARRNLLEVIKGVHIDSETKVLDTMAQSDVVLTRIQGVLQGSAILETRLLADGSYESVVAIPLTGALSQELLSLAPPLPTKPAPVHIEESTPPSPEPAPEHIVERTLPAPEPAPPATEHAPPLPERTGYTGLVIDARNMGFKPSLRPELHGQDSLLYPGPNADTETAVRRGYVRYYTKLDQAQQSELVGDLPLTVKAASLHQGRTGALTLPDREARQLESILAAPGNFLDRCNVVIVF